MFLHAAALELPLQWASAGRDAGNDASREAGRLSANPIRCISPLAPLGWANAFEMNEPLRSPEGWADAAEALCKGQMQVKSDTDAHSIGHDINSEDTGLGNS